MNQKQSIFNLLAKKPATKLSASRKVKMASVNELQALLDDLSDYITQNNRSVSALNQAAEEVTFTATDVLLYWERVQSAGEEVLSSANELGMDAYSIPAVGEYLQYTKSEYIKNAEAWQDEAKRILQIPS